MRLLPLLSLVICLTPSVCAGDIDHLDWGRRAFAKRSRDRDPPQPVLPQEAC